MLDIDAGMIVTENSSKLVLCLEPEAACMACEHSRSSEGPAASDGIAKVGDQFMVLDCGGGTVDITMHQVESMAPMRLSEVREPAGGPFGSKFVDGEFEEFLKKLIGEASWKKFKPSSAWGPCIPSLLITFIPKP